MKREILKLLEKALKKLAEKEKFDFKVNEIEVNYPKSEIFGDYTTNLAMILAKKIKKDSMKIAEEIVGLVEKPSQNFEKIETVKPGYINFYLSEKYLQNKIKEINSLKEGYGNSQMGKGIKVNNEFISANPTGPLHLGNGRGGFLGDTISNILKKSGFETVSEYYINDTGEQIIKLGHSVLKDNQAVYAGEYIDKLNKKFKNIGDAEKIGEKATEIILKDIIKKTIQDKMKINFNSWISEKKDLYASGKIEKAIEIFKKKNLTYKNQDALWLKTTQFGDDKDRVLIKKNGQKTYFISDCGYILNKMERGFNKLIEIWGADHYGYVQRFRAAAEALGFQGDLKFIIIQLVRLVKNGKEARMSKRAGNVVYIDKLIKEVGRDATRFFFLMYSPDTHMNFDLNLAKERSEKNPVYYIQYAHARISSIIAKHKTWNAKYKTNKKIDFSLLTQKKEVILMRELNKFPELVEEIAQTYNVHKLPYYAIKLADKFHSFYNDIKVLDEEKPALSEARLELVKAVKIVLAEVLRLMGVSAPENM